MNGHKRCCCSANHPLSTLKLPCSDNLVQIHANWLAEVQQLKVYRYRIRPYAECTCRMHPLNGHACRSD